MAEPVVVRPTPGRAFAWGYRALANERRASKEHLLPPAKHPHLRQCAPGGKCGALADDLQQHVLSYSTPQDLCRVLAVSRSFGSVASKEDLWKALATNGSMISPEHVEPAMSLLGLSTYRQLVEALTRVGIPAGVLGYWKAKSEHPARGGSSKACAASARGELLCITITTGGFLCESIEPDGSRSKIFRVRVRVAVGSKGLSVAVHSLESEFCLGGVYSPTGLAQRSAHYYGPVLPPMLAGLNAEVPAAPAAGCRLTIRRAGGRSFIMSRGGRVQTFEKLAAPAWVPPPASFAAPAGLPQDLGGLCGLWSAPYGSHGLEILDVTLESGIAAAATEPFATNGWPGADGGATGSNEATSATAAGPSCVLRGTKVVGDLYVPAGECSFAVDMGRAYDPDEQLGNDPQLVVSFLPGGAVIDDLQARRLNVAGWHKGWGQINRTPGTWSPSWVLVDLLVYREGSTAFSVVWSEAAEPESTPVRVIIDFQRLPGCAGSWPDWSAVPCVPDGLPS